MESYTADVLVIGGGIAALNAAKAAREKGCTVIVASKGAIGKSGCSLISEGILNAPFAETDSPALFAADTMKASAGVAKKELVWALSEHAREAVLGLEQSGISFERHDDGSLNLKLSGGHSVPRTVRVTPPGPGCGKVIPKGLAANLGNGGLTLLNGHTVVKVLTEGGRVEGAVAFTGTEFAQISCKAIVLATGGAGKVYPYTTNPNGIMGDGSALALDAGASLVDMEYVQFFPTVALSSYLLLPFIFADGAILLNSKGERFIGKYDPDLMEATTRDKMSQAIFTEAMEGRGIEGGACFSCEKMDGTVLKTKYAQELAHFGGKGYDLTRDKVPVRPACHFFMGGVDIDQFCNTSVQGLFACGECAGGTHGANRLAGNALPEALVFGSIAGGSAAAYAADAEMPVADPAAFLDSLPARTDVQQAPYRDTLRELAWERLGIIREAEGLAFAREELATIRDELAACSETSDLSAYFEARTAADVLMAVAVAADVRKESRGAHYRIDYPGESKSWKKAIRILPGFGHEFDPR
jgi:fumarate reductase (CoM/CoB) subunit A